MNLHHFQFAIDQKSIVKKADGSVAIEGMASTDVVDRHGDVILPSAYEGTLETYMANPQILLSHDTDKPIGKCVEAQIKENGLWVRAEVTENIDDVIGKIERGVFGAFSVGFFAKRYEYLYEGRVVFDQDGLRPDATWEEFYAADLRRITEVDLVEISVVSVPANPAALFDVAKAVRKALAIETKGLIPKQVAAGAVTKSEENPAAVAEAAEGKTEEGEEVQTVAETAENAEQANAEAVETPGETPEQVPAATDEKSGSPETEDGKAEEAGTQEPREELVPKSVYDAEMASLRAELSAKDAAIEDIRKELGEVYGTIAQVAAISRNAHKAAAKAEKGVRLMPVNKGFANIGTKQAGNVPEEESAFLSALDAKVAEIRSR